VISQICLAYLAQFNTSDPLDMNLDISFPLAYYAAENWIIHVHSSSKSKSESSSSFTLMVRFFTDKNSAFENWVRICDIDDFERRDLQKESKDIAKPLYYASSAGLTESLWALLNSRADMDEGGIYGNGLQAALYGGNEVIEKLMIEKEVDVNAVGGRYGTALQAASYEGHEAIARLLIENGADVNAQGGYYGNALHAALIEGHEAIAKLLIENGADVNALQATSY
jgi:ankyrin repeat protein